MIQFPPEFYGMCTAFWNVYQPIILIWMGIMQGGVMALGFGIVVSSVIRAIWVR